jgi:hypothetical protein
MFIPALNVVHTLLVLKPEKYPLIFMIYLSDFLLRKLNRLVLFNSGRIKALPGSDVIDFPNKNGIDPFDLTGLLFFATFAVSGLLGGRPRPEVALHG